MSNKTWCPGCGPGVEVDDDGFCTECESIAIGHGVDLIYAELEKCSPDGVERQLLDRTREMFEGARREWEAGQAERAWRAQAATREANREHRNIETHLAYLGELKTVNAYRKQDMEIKERNAAALEGILLVIKQTAGLE